MENASKALIIAGAILLSILLISLGIMIFNTAQDTTKNSGMNQAQVASFNNKFTKYEGDIKGSEVRSLIQEIIASNGDENNINANRLITVTGAAAGTGTSIPSSGIKTTSTYTVSITTHTADGYINGISITLNNSNKQS